MFCEIKIIPLRKSPLNSFFSAFFIVFRMFFRPCVFSFIWCAFFLTSLFLIFRSLFFFCVFRCMQLSIKEWKSLFSVLSKKKISLSLPVSLFADFLKKKKTYLHVLVTLFFESLLSFFLYGASHKKNDILFDSPLLQSILMCHHVFCCSSLFFQKKKLTKKKCAFWYLALKPFRVHKKNVSSFFEKNMCSIFIPVVLQRPLHTIQKKKKLDGITHRAL